MTVSEKLAKDPELARSVIETFGPDPNAKADRLTVRFDPKTLSVWPSTVQRRRTTNRLPGAVVTHYVENPVARTPSGGRYVARRFTVVIGGVKWYGTCRKDSDLVTLRKAGT